jgi:hypothetical protein
MPRKRKGTVARQQNAQTALEARVSKRRRSHSNLGAEQEISSDNESVCPLKASLMNTIHSFFLDMC